jgi:2-isopropylmalate synthase
VVLIVAEKEEKKHAEPERVIIFDTTLRDGEQSPGASMTKEEKIEVAKHLDTLGVDVIEAGFPVSNQKDFEVFKIVAKEVNAQVCGLARCVEKDIQTAWDAIKEAKNPRIHVFLATSDIHLKHKLGITKEEAVEKIKKQVAYAKSFCENIEFSAEDASRTEPEFLKKAFSTAIESGATTLNIPDTVGYAQPKEFGGIVKNIAQMPEVKENKINISTHCHDDLGLATANSLEGILNGANQVECTINGIGERAGNAALEEIVMSLKTRKDYYNKYTGIITEQLVPVSKIVSEKTSMVVQKNKAIVGANAFAHESGVHQHGVIMYNANYEIMSAASVGAKSKIVLGKLSGKHAVAEFLKGKGLPATEEVVQKALEAIKNADKNKNMEELVIEIVTQNGVYFPKKVLI